MPQPSARDLYQVKPGSTVDLSEWDPQDISLYPDESKSSHDDLFESLRSDLASLQKVLYAEDKQRILVVIQAMDTGGKDGCVKSVFATVDPQGVTVVPFKKPSGAPQRTDQHLQPLTLRGYHRGACERNLPRRSLASPSPTRR